MKVRGSMLEGHRVRSRLAQLMKEVTEINIKRQREETKNEKGKSGIG
jgi:hypothetical protein